jgi:hypothetical protein
VSVKIFISCVSDEFRAYRDQLRHDLTRPNVEVKVQEDFKDLGGVALDKLDVYISACDAVVHLIGDMTGAAAKPASTRAILAKYPDIAERLPPLRGPLERGKDISYTQWEAWLALYHGKALLIAQADKVAPRGPNFAPTGTSRAAQQAHLDRLRAVERYPGCTFASRDQLAKQIAYTTVLDLLAKERSGATPRDAGWLPFAGLVIGMLVILVTPSVSDQWAKMLGVPVAAPLALMLAVGGFALPFSYLRYFIMLGASDEPVGSGDRKGYDALRDNLATGGHAVRLYSRWLRVFLDAVDRFFGDAGMANQTLFPHAFGLQTPAPLWTAPAFDRCLLLALIYPVLTILIIWALSGDVGPAGPVLGLKAGIGGWARGSTIVLIVGSVVSYQRATGSVIWWIVFNILMVLVIFGGMLTFTLAGTVIILVAKVGAGAFAIIFGFLFTCALAVLGPLIGFSDLGGAFIFAVIGAVAILGQFLPAQRRGASLSLYLCVMIVMCFAAAVRLPHSEGWRFSGPVLLFVGLVPLINAPFDWASLGLTRALLRRGLDLKNWWPFVLALVDALSAAVIVALLALAMVIGVQTFDALAVHGGGKPVLPLRPLLDGIAAHPEAPEYWWVYALLLSTTIPSVINLIIGGTALMRAVPGLSPLLLNHLPADGSVRSYDRAWIAAALTGQVTLGVILGVGVQALLAYGVIFYAMPAVGLGLLDVARGLADLELPMRLIQLLDGAS